MDVKPHYTLATPCIPYPSRAVTALEENGQTNMYHLPTLNGIPYCK